MTERVSLSPTGGQMPLGTGALNSMTPDGRFVAFVGHISEPLGNSATAVSDVFVRDRRTGSTAVASVASDGSAGVVPPGSCFGADAPAISANGRYVAFVSCYANLVPAGNNTINDDEIYVHDMKTGITTSVSVADDGAQALGDSSYPTISADGRYVAFQSTAKNLVASTCDTSPGSQQLCQLSGQTPFTINQVYVRDTRGHGSTRMVSARSDGSPPDGESYFPSISADGRFVAFTSNADDLTANDVNVCTTMHEPRSCPDVYLRDLKSRTTELLSVGLDGSSATGRYSGSTTWWVDGISKDDRYVAFTSDGTDLVPSPPAGWGLYVRDRKTHRTENVSVDSAGQPIHGPVSFGISPDGRYLVGDGVTGLVACQQQEPSPGVVVLHDRTTGATQVIGRTDARGRQVPCSEYYNASNPEITSGGRLVSFVTNGAHLVPDDTNKHGDVFVLDRGTPLGAGDLAADGRLSVAGDRSFPTSYVVARRDVTSDVGSPLTAQGANLIGATLAYRPTTADLFVRLPVQRMPMFAAASPALVYGLNVTVDGTRYQVRAAKTGLGASFGLFRLDLTGWTNVAQLRGGYGTTGQEVVFALPLADVGLQHGGQIRAVRAFIGMGSYSLGAADTVDRVAF